MGVYSNLQAYSNPEILVDTQSAQHWRDMQKSISGTFEKVAGDLAAIAKKNKEYGEKAELNIQIAKDLTSKMDVDNPNMNIQEALKPLIDEYAILQTNIAFGKSKNITEDRYKSDQIRQAIKKTQGMVENNLSFGSKFREKAVNMGRVGGYSQYNDPQAMAMGAIQTNNERGKIDLAFDPTTYEPSLVYYSKIKTDDGADGYTEISRVDSKKMEAYAAENGGLKVIPAATDLFESLKKNPTIFGSNGEILPDFQTKEKRTVKTVSKDTITNNKKDKDIDIVNTRTFIVPNADSIKANLEQSIDASIEGMASVGDLTVFYNQYVAPNSPVPLNSNLTPEQKKTTRDWISNSFIKTLPGATEDKNAPEEVSFVTRQTVDTSNNTGNQNKNQKTVDKQERIKNITASLANNIPGTIMESTGGDKHVVIVKDNSGKISYYPSNKQGVYKPEAQPLEGKALKLYLNYNK